MAGYVDESLPLLEDEKGSNLDLTNVVFVSDSTSAYKSREAKHRWTYTRDNHTVNYDFERMSQSQWNSFCKNIGRFHNGFFYDYMGKSHYSINYHTQEGIISGYMFSDCTSLKHIALPQNIIEIKEAAFSNCCCLQDIQLPPCVKSVGNAAFINCSSLYSVTY